MQDKITILFVGDGTSLSHTIRPYILANLLDSNKYDVHYAGAKKYEHLFKDAPFPTYPLYHYPSSDRHLKAREENKTIQAIRGIYSRELLSEMVEEDLKLLKIVQPRLVIGDARASLGISAPRSNVPYACLINAAWNPGIKKTYTCFVSLSQQKLFGKQLAHYFTKQAFALIWKMWASNFNYFRRINSLPKVNDFSGIFFCADYVLYLDVPKCFPIRTLPTNHFYLGPMIDFPSEADIESDWDTFDNKTMPIIYVSIGASGDKVAFSRIIEALQDQFNLLITTSERLEAQQLSSNIKWFEYLPGKEVAKKVALFITNGGSGSGYQALSQGVPVLGIVNNPDQEFIMSGIANSAAGIYLDSRTITADSIRKAVEELLYNPSYKEGADAIKKEITEYDVRTKLNKFLASF